MAGLSQRFLNAGFNMPKYMLIAHGKTLFAHAVNSFSDFFCNSTFHFIVRNVYNTEDFVSSECQRLGIKNFHITVLDKLTSGQAETVALGLRLAAVHSSTPITVFNIDTFRPSFRFPNVFELNKIDGYLEVFRGSGSNWSYVKPSLSLPNTAIATAEKRAISDLCCTGLYYFRSVSIYMEAYEKSLFSDVKIDDHTEIYVAPLYNYLIQDGCDIKYNIISRKEVIFCGVPSEFKEFSEASVNM